MFLKGSEKYPAKYRGSKYFSEEKQGMRTKFYQSKKCSKWVLDSKIDRPPNNYDDGYMYGYG